VAGIADLKEYLTSVNRRITYKDNIVQRYWDRFMGVSGPTDPKLHEISPIDHVAAITVPVLLIHGRDDTVVPLEQSERMASALERSGKSVEMVKLDGEDHWLSSSATRLQMLTACIAFLKAHNPPN
jgi:dipeptidyl aminopeptidase/acylaminoacyl peptidase